MASRTIKAVDPNELDPPRVLEICDAVTHECIPVFNQRSIITGATSAFEDGDEVYSVFRQGETLSAPSNTVTLPEPPALTMAAAGLAVVFILAALRRNR